MLLIFLKLFLMQAAVAAVVVFILKKILDRHLVEIAIKKFESVKLTPEDQKLNGIMVLTFGNLNNTVQARLLKIAEEKFGRPVQIFIKRRRDLRSGVIIQLNSITIDYSLIGRLKEGGIILENNG